MGTASFTLPGLGYTVFSESLHTNVLGSSVYGSDMPTVLVGLMRQFAPCDVARGG